MTLCTPSIKATLFIFLLVSWYANVVEARAGYRNIDCCRLGPSAGWNSTIWLVNLELPARYVDICFHRAPRVFRVAMRIPKFPLFLCKQCRSVVGAAAQCATLMVVTFVGLCLQEPGYGDLVTEIALIVAGLCL